MIDEVEISVFRHLTEVIARGGSTFLSIGGAGVLDGIFLVGVIAAFLSPGVAKRKPRPVAAQT